MVVIIGAGPAGLTAAYELTRHGLSATVLEADPVQVGGLSRTGSHKGFRFDIGGHRFFSKNEEVEKLWTELMGPDMLTVRRLSRILYRGRYFDYPLRAVNAFLNLGLFETFRCLASYLSARAHPRQPVVSFEDWVVNRFGRRLFEIFFKTYTEKVWGMACNEISADWAAQRIRGLTLLDAVKHALGLNTPFHTTLVDSFRYPRLGPGMLWERLTQRIQQSGCSVEMGARVERVTASGVWAGGRLYQAEHVISSMPLRDLVAALDPPAPATVRRAAEGLYHRDFLTVVLFVDQPHVFPDNWIYVHEPGVRVGRIQNYKNWSPEMVPGADKTGLGLEYFCFVGDSLWAQDDSSLIAMATAEAAQLGLMRAERVLDGTVVRMPYAYPVYDEGYLERIQVVRAWLGEHWPRLQVVGRNGMHRYDNQDQAMVSGLLAARNLAGLGPYDPWTVSVDAEYLEERKAPRRL